MMCIVRICWLNWKEGSFVECCSVELRFIEFEDCIEFEVVFFLEVNFWYLFCRFFDIDRGEWCRYFFFFCVFLVSLVFLEM